MNSVPSGRPSDEVVPPRFDTHPQSAYTIGPLVVELCESIGYFPDVHQRLVLDRLFACRDDDHLVTVDAALVAPRQNLKSAALLMAVLGWLYVEHLPLIAWTCQDVKTSREMHRKLGDLIKGNDMLRSRLLPGRSEGVNSANGNLAVELAPSAECPNGQRVLFQTRTDDLLRGFSGDRVVIDEAYALKPEHLEAVRYILRSRRNPQIVFASSAAHADSMTLHQIVKQGRAGAKTLTYLEWCAWRDSCAKPSCNHRPGTPGCVLDDLDEMRHANPSMGTWRYDAAAREWYPSLNKDAIEAEMGSNRVNQPILYAREVYGWHEEPLEGDPILPGDTWERMGIDPSPFEPRLAVDVSPARTWACIAASGVLSNGQFAVEVTGTDDGPDYREGVGWVVDRLVELREVVPDRPVLLAAGSGAESLRPDLDARGIPYEVVPVRDVQAACGSFMDLSMSARLVHFRQPSLTGALVAARMRNTESGFRWERRKSAGDISPLYAATLALWGAQQSPAEPEPQFWSWNDL